MSDNTVVTENDLTSVVEVTSAGPAGPPGGALTIQDEGVDEGLLTDKINFAGSTVSVVNDTEAEIATVTVNAADPGANTNITSLGGITGGISSPDYVQFDTAAAAAGAVGRLLWNDTDGTLEFQMKGGNVTLQIGQEEVIRVTNKAGVTMTDGQAVYITGSTGNHLNVTLAQANAEATSSKTLAVVTETIANNNTGFATSSGLVRGLDTSALTEGAAIWLSPTVPGGLTTTRPTAPDHAVLIGWCVRQHASVGVIYVHIANGYELDELHDVLITAAANNQVLRYDAATGLWKNATISPTLTLNGDVSGSATFTDLGNATLTATVADDSHNHIISNVDGLQDALDSKLPAASYTAADVLTKIKTVDGTGSGLDADLLNGQDGAHYLDFTNATNKPDPTITLSGDATGSVTLTDLTSGTLNVTVVDDSHNHVIANVDGLQDALDSKLAAASYTATDVLDKIKTVDGAGSGLDADLLDGQSSSYYTAINDRLGYTAENAANKGVAGGYASLDGAGLVPATQLPSYVDDVLEFANLAAFPVTGETGKIYVAVDTAKTYRWSGTTYVEISASPGSTDAVPEGSSNLYFTAARARQSVSAGTGISYNSSTGVITNAAPDQTVSITGSGTTTVTGTYPNFTVSSADQYVGTVTSVSGTGTVNGLTLTGSVTSSGSLTLGGTLSVDLSTATVTGTLPVTKGGTGATSLTSGYLLKGNGTSAVSASVVYDDGTNVGIGTPNPTWGRLEVFSGSTNKIRLYNTSGNGNTIDFLDQSWQSQIVGSAGNLLFNTGGTSEKMRIDASGNLLVGTTAAYGGRVNVVPATTPTTISGANQVQIGESSSNTGYRLQLGYLNDPTHGFFSSIQSYSGGVAGNLILNGAGGNVGIGTSSPSARLTLQESAASPTALNMKNRNSTQQWALAVDAAAVDDKLLAFIDQTNSAVRMALDTSGNLGLGVTPSAWYTGLGLKALQVGEAALVNQTNGYSWFQRNAFTDASNVQKYIANGYATRYQQGDGAHAWLTAPSGTAGNAISFTQAMTLDASGNLLVGTTTPAYSTSGRGLIEVNGSSSAIIAVKTGDTARGYFGASTALTELSAVGASQPLAFTTNNTERMRIKSSGGVRYTPLASAPASPEAGEVYYDSTTNKLRCYNGTTWNDLF